jgi:pyruvate/2-oxoglutarate dehydrogenase complex dihydrolipoamide acyltransferase (E2) component
VTVGGVTLGMNMDSSGILAQIKHENDSVIPVGEEIAVVANNRENYLSYFEKLRLQMIEEQKTKEFNEDYQMKHQKPNTTVLLRVIKSLIREGKIDSGSGKSIHFRPCCHLIFIRICFTSADSCSQR